MKAPTPSPVKPADDNEEVLFWEALERAKGPEREAYLDQACAGNEALRRRLGALLQADESPYPFLEPQVGDLLGQITTRPAPDFTVEEAGVRIGRYKLLEKIGEGGCGMVYMAEQEEPIRRRVAFKVIKLGMDTEQVIARFESERQALALMDHPNIAKVLDAGATGTGRPYFVMELVRGIRITDYCDQNNLSTEERLKLFVQVCHAIQHAHQKGIIHRDIKPSNILVTLHDGVPVPKVIDFGIAKATTGQCLTDKTLFTAFQQFVGTPAYMSPEQAEMSGLDVDTRSDIYALGVLLYELLTGQTPFEQKALVAAGLDEMRRIIREQEPVRPSTRLSTLTDPERTTVAKRRGADPPQLIHLLRGDLDWIVMKALEKDRTRRYETANGVAEDVLRHLNNEPVAARPPSLGYRLQKSLRRNRLVFTAAGLVGLALVLGAVVSLWQAIRATEAGRREQAARLRADEAARVADSQRDRAEKEAQKAKASELVASLNLYVANMQRAQEAGEQNNVGRLWELLEQTATYPARGFEWYYWQRQMHLELLTLRGHLDKVQAVAFSPDGQRIVTGSFDGTAKVWDAASGKDLLTCKGHRAGINSVAFSPDGQQIVTGSFDGTAKVWDSVSGKELLTLKGHGVALLSAAFSPEGRRIVTGHLGGIARVWDSASGKLLLTIGKQGADYAVASVAFSPDGQRIVAGHWDGKGKGTAKVWAAATGQLLLTLEGQRAGSSVASVALSPDQQRIVTGHWDAIANVWEAASGKLLLTLKGHGARIASVAFSRDGGRIATGSDDDTAKVWDSASGTELLTFKGHRGWVTSVAFSPDGHRVATGSYDRTAKVWEVGNHKEVRTLNEIVVGVAFSPDGQRIAASCFDGSAKVLEAASGKELLSFKAHTTNAPSVAFSPDGRRIATGSYDGTAKVWDAANGKELLLLKGHRDGVFCVAFSSDSQRIATGCLDGTVKVWDAAGGKELLSFTGHAAMINSVAFSPDGRRILTGSDDPPAKVWDAASGKLLLTLNWQSQSQSVAFSPDGHRIVAGHLDGTVKVWDAASGTELLTFKGDSGWVMFVVFSPDGQRLATCCSDGSAKLWDAATGKDLLTLKRPGADSGVISVAFSPDGLRIAASCADHTLRVWEAATAQQVAAWQKEEKEAEERGAVLRSKQAVAAQHGKAIRAQDLGAIKQWLVLAPIPFQDQTGEGALKALDQQQVSQEPGLRPRAQDQVQVGASALVWNALQQQDYLLDFNQLLGKNTEWSLAYAVFYIQSEAARTGIVMKVGSDDEAKIYLNGREIYRNETARACVPEQDEVTGIELRAGLNVLVFKVVNETLGWQGSVRFTDAAGQPLKGIRVTLDPEAKD
jgi:WD40 repeat protein/serine/threonine protein kinase